jgi:hypothetical protein
MPCPNAMLGIIASPPSRPRNQNPRFLARATKENPKNDGDRFQLTLSQIAGKRFAFAEVTGKVGQTGTESEAWEA